MRQLDLVIPLGVVLALAVTTGTFADGCPEDIDGNGAVDVGDLVDVILDWNCTDPPGPCIGDVTGDGVVDVGDLVAVILAWGDCPACGPGTGPCFQTHEGPGCQNVDCCRTVCAIAPVCCDVEWDGTCATLALAHCGDCGTPAAGDCFDANGTIGCADGACCAIVCTIRPACCAVAWDATCANLALQNCENPPGACCLPTGGCIADVSLDQCEANGGTYQGIGTLCDDVTCPDLVGACCLPGGTCENRTQTLCIAGGGLFFGPESSCATTQCDFPVACPGTGSCFAAHATGGCDDETCCDLVCAQDPACCQVQWDVDCVNAANSICGDDDCPGTGTCFAAAGNGSPGCDDASCCNIVCADDGFCCDVEWDPTCAELARAICPNSAAGACCLPGGDCLELTLPNECFAAGGAFHGIGTACAGVTCSDVVGACCLPGGACSDTNPGFCIQSGGVFLGASVACADAQCAFPECPGTGSCFIDNGTPGCDDETCCDLVCAANPFCCSVTWDSTCADAAVQLCGSAECPGEGDCFTANGSPGCANEACCDYVCDIDTFCCATLWDAVCAEAALGCPTAPLRACFLPASGTCIVTTLALCTGQAGLPAALGTDCTDTDGDRIADAFEADDCAGNGWFSCSDPNDPDTDGDGLGDGDEFYGTLDGLDLRGLGADPCYPDLYVEVDWFDESEGGSFHSHRPTAAQIDAVVAAFAGSPFAGPCGTTGIALHFDYGQGGAFTGGNLIAGGDTVVVMDSEFNTYKAVHFAANRNGYFHYAIFCHRYDASDNNSSGYGELPGDDFIVSLQSGVDDDLVVAGTIMHELGHNLNLRHGGFQNANYKPNYNSIMNYRYQFGGVDTDCNITPDGLLDYSSGTNDPLDENALSELVGVCGGVPIDWNQDGVLYISPIAWNINCPEGCSQACGDSSGCGADCYDTTCNLLLDNDDWNATLDLALGLTEADFAPPERVRCQDVPEAYRTPPGSGDD